MRDFFRQNPQVLLLLVITLVLGVGTFIAVIAGLVSSGNGHITGEPSGAVQLLRAGVSAARAIG